MRVLAWVYLMSVISNPAGRRGLPHGSAACPGRRTQIAS